MEIGSIKSPYSLIGVKIDGNDAIISDSYEKIKQASRPKITTVESEYESIVDEHYMKAAFNCIRTQKQRDIFRIL